MADGHHARLLKGMKTMIMGRATLSARLLTWMLLLSLLGAEAQVPGSPDMTFHPTDQGWWMGAGFNHLTADIGFQADGKAVVGGYFSAWNGLSLNSPQGGARAITRLTTTGIKDAAFGPATSAAGFNSGGAVTRLEVLGDGSIIAIGTFTSFGGVSRNRIIKLMANGTLDAGFQVGTGFNNAPLDFCVQSDGRIVVVGATSYNGTATNYIVRLNTDGSRDNTFQTGTGFTGTSSPYTVGCNTSGIYIGGGPQLTYNGTVCGSVVRLFYNGALDTGFTPSVPWNQFAYHLAVTNFDVAVLYVSGISSFELRRYLPSGATDGSFTTLTGTGGNLFGDLVRTSSGGYYVGGTTGTVSGQAHGGLFRVTATGQMDATFNASIDLQGTTVYAVGVQSDGKVIAVCSTQSEYEAVKCEGRLKPNVLRFSSTGALDAPYSPGYGFYPVSTSTVKDAAIQSDGKIITTGDFKSYDQYIAGGICRMSADGAWDATFLATGVGGIGPSVNAVALQADGKILTGGYFSAFNGQPAGAFLRLNANGTTDNTFQFGAGFDAAATVHAILIQPDAKILLAGRFTTLNGTACGDVVRLNANGTVDASFSGPSVTSASSDVLCLELLPDGRVYIGGSFTALNGTGVNRAARLMPTGAVDATFNIGSGFDGVVRCSYLMPDGRILFGGQFANYNGTPRTSMTSCLADGTIDPSIVFSLNSFQGIWDIQRQPNGKFFLCGKYYCSTGGSGGYSDLVRFHPNGQLDGSFHTDASSYDHCERVDVLPSGKILLIGPFMRIATGGVDTGRNGIARLYGGDPQVRISPKVLLEGPYVEAAGTMMDGLRSAGLIPLAEPYSGLGFAYSGNGGGGTTTSLVLNVAGNNAIADWVVVELRDTVAPYPVLASRAALVQRDGDVVDFDGTSPVLVNGNAQKYHVAVRHRNHFAVMTAAPVTLTTSNATVIDFTNPATLIYGTNAEKQVGTRMVLWAGDATGDGTLKYTGAANDRDPILIAVGSTTPNNTVPNVYDRRDTNLDGVIKYTGSANDRDIILTNVGSTTPNNTRTQQLP
jgi:uncharacterized delta-60 repeat protein